MIGCAAIILAGLSYKDKEKYLDYGLVLLKKIINFSFDSEGFPKSRNFRQLIFYLKYFILIREWLKESQNEIPEYLNEIIFNLGQAYNFSWQNTKESFLFNGNHIADNSNFDKYLKLHGYKFKNENNECGGYIILKNKNILLTTDIGPAPEKKFSNNYQSGTLSFEIYFKGKKLISNSGYFQNYKKKKILEKDYFSIIGSHDGYLKEYGIIHERQIEFFAKSNKFIGKDRLIRKKNFKSTNFEIRFHFEPETKITKTQEGKIILIELVNSGWRFFCKDHPIDVETGLYFGKKSSFSENQNIFISGFTNNQEQEINWEIIKI